MVSDKFEFDWEAVAKQVFDGDERPVILFDVVCFSSQTSSRVDGKDIVNEE